MTAVLRVIRAAAKGHRLPNVVVALVVLASTATSVISIALLAAADAPFDHAFARAHGAHATVVIDGSMATLPAIAATAQRPDVTAAGGPYQQLTLALSADGISLPDATIVGRDRPDGPVDQLTLEMGRWPRRAGEIAVGSTLGGRHSVGQQLATGNPAAPTLTVVGLARSITQTADGWVTAAQAHALEPRIATVQMLYRFRSASTDSAIHAAIAAHGRRPGSEGRTRRQAPILGFDSACSARPPQRPRSSPLSPCSGLVISALIVGNVVSGAVIAGYRRVGILKALGFTPTEVVMVFAGRALLPTLFGCLVGAGIGTALGLAGPQPAGAAYQVGSVGVPPWAIVGSVLGMLLIVASAAALPAMRAARLSAAQALSLGRTPRQGRGNAGPPHPRQCQAFHDRWRSDLLHPW